MMYINRILQLIEENGLSARSFAQKIGLSANCVSEWKSGRIKPSLEHIIRIAAFFDVSADYLLGLSDSRKYIVNDNQINALYDELSDIDKEKVKAYINDLLQAQKYAELVTPYKTNKAREIAAFGGKLTNGTPPKKKPEIT